MEEGKECCINLYFVILRCCVTSECLIRYVRVSQLFVRQYSKYFIDIIPTLYPHLNALFFIVVHVIELLFLVRHLYIDRTLLQPMSSLCALVLL